MSSNKENQDGLPEIYLSPTHHPGQGHGAHASSDTEPNAWEDTDSESGTGVLPEVILGSPPATASSLYLREEIEGGSSLDTPVSGTSQERDTENNSERIQNTEPVIPRTEECESKTLLSRGRSHIPKQRGETPGSDCPPVAGITAFVRRFGQPLNLDTQTQMARSSELIFSPGGDQGFIVPGGVHAYYGSTSDIETLEWADSGGLALVPIRDAVEGADAVPSPDQAMDSSVEDLERNSPAGLSTPDAEVDLSGTSEKTLVTKKPQKGIRPPAVGQSEEVLMQTSRKDLGSTDGEESEEETRKRTPQEATATVSNSAETQLGSIGSQSENTDSMSTVLDMRRGEVQGCERDHVSSTGAVSSALGNEASFIQPAFVVGGLISPRGKLRLYQDVVRGRMQDVKASLKLGSDSTGESMDRQHYLNHLPLCPPVIPPCEPEVSLASLVSVESTNPPESSDRVTSPSVLSVSSVASSKRMEWDSGADVGYLGTNTHVTPAASLSTLERIALGSYASVLRTEPEGTTQAKEKQRAFKKGGKSGTIKGSSNGATSKQFATDQSASSPLQSARVHQSRTNKVCLSSSEEDLSNKLSSPNQSPRRRLRRRGLASPQEGDVSHRRSTRAMHFMNRTLRETTQEHHNEGKSCSLVELATPAVSSDQCQRSNSQQLLPTVSPSDARSSINVVPERDSSGAGTSASSNKKGEQLVTNTSTSTSTLVQSMSPLPLPSTLANNSMTSATPGVFQHQPVGKDHKSVTGDSRCSSMSSLTIHDKEYLQNQHGKPSWTSSGNDMTSRSETSSPGWLPSHTDTEGLTSCPLSTDELGDLKARKNSENAKNHEYMVRRGSSSDLETREVRKDSSSSSTGHLADPQNAAADTESTLESQVSLQSFNNALHALSVKLQDHIQALLDNGSLKKVQDYNKLQDYVRFVGIPSVTEEECRLRQGVAGVITRMFGEIAFDLPLITTDTSNTFTSETSDSHAGDQRLPTPGTCEDLDVLVPWNESGSKKDDQEHDSKEQGQQGSGEREEKQHPAREEEEQGEGEEQEKTVLEQDRCTTPGGTVLVVPYRPPSASRTYFMAVSHEWEAGLVEGEHVPAAVHADLSRGQAEGEQEERIATAPVTHHLPHVLSENCSSNEWDSEKLMSVEGATLRDEDHKTLPSLPSDHYLLRRSQDTGTPQSESSPDHSNSSLLHTWPKEELSSSQWWAGGSGCERLYQDRRGGLHVAHQPPGYTDDHDDSHPSESLSDHDHHHRRHSGEGGRLPAHPWTSSGSESAYETIRERHRHVDEALASSFEFYSTSPRDARLLGYISSEGQEEEERPRVESPVAPLSPTRSDSATQSKNCYCQHQQQHQHQHQHEHQHQHQHHQQQQQQQQAESQNSTPSSHTDAHDVSSQISFIQLQKQKYVRKIQRHIQTLEKLEKALLDQLGDSITSEGTFKQRVTEGNSCTGSDTNGNVHTHDLLGHSDTTTGSIMSSESSTEAAKKQEHLPYSSRISKSNHPSGQESPSPSNDGKDEETVLSQGPSGTGQSYTSSPRVNISQLSSDVNSSRASTMRQVEEEVKKLATAEERSRRVVLQPHLHSQSRSKQRTKPWGEEGPAQSGFNSQSPCSNSPEISLLGRRRPPSSFELSTTRTTIGSGSFELRSVQALPRSGESAGDLPASESQISRQCDGCESKDKTQAGMVPLTTITSGKILTFKSSAAPEVAVSESSTVPQNDILSKDFGQMFPSTECIARDSDRREESVGVQTGDSLLYPGKSSRKRDNVTSVSTSDRESTTESLRNKKIWSKVKQATGYNEDTDCTKNRMKKPSHGRTSDKIKPITNRKHYTEKTCRPSEVSKGKEMTKGMKKNKESKSKSYEQANITNKKISSRSRKEILRDKPQPSREHQGVIKSGKEETARLRNRTTPFKNKSRPKSGSEDRTVISDSSLSQSVESISMESSDHGETSSGKAESVNNERRYWHSNEGDSISVECIEAVQHPQHDLNDSNSDNASANHYYHTPGKQNYNKDGQFTTEEPVQGLKGGAEESLTPEAPGWLLISPPVSKDRSKQKTRSTKSSVTNDGKSKSAKTLLTTIKTVESKREENLKNKANLVQHSTQEETTLRITSQGSGSARMGQHTKPGTLKVGWLEDKQVVPEQKKPVRFEVTFFNKEGIYIKSKPPASTITSTTTITHTTKEPLTLQEALAMARPDYIREAGDRSALIRLKRDMRQAAQTHNHNVLAQLPPNLQTPSTLQRFLYKPDLAPLFSYKDIRQQNQRLYGLLPEARAPRVRQHLSAVHHTNRLLANLYSQRLRKKVIQGRVSHAHKAVVTPLVHRVLQQ